MSNNFRHGGFSLIELLIALIVFSIGLLAVAGLQTVSKQSNFEALQRTSGSQIAHGLLEDMRINGDAMNVYLAAGEIGGGSRGAVPSPHQTARAPPFVTLNRKQPMISGSGSRFSTATSRWMETMQPGASSCQHFASVGRLAVLQESTPLRLFGAAQHP